MAERGDLYEVLGVSRTASAEEIRSAYRRLAAKTHPDIGGTSYMFRLVREAYDTLSDPARRTEYDRTGSAQPREESSEPPPADSGWVRVDEPGESAGEGYPPPSSGGQHPGGPDGAGWTPGWQPPPGYRGQPPQGRTGGDLARIAASRPWLVPVGIGGFFFLASGVDHSLGGLAMLFLLVGLVAAIGSRRARARMALRSTPVAEIDVMDGTQFELFCAEVLRANGYRAEHVGQSGDYGADLLISNRPGWRAVVQAKRYTGNVGLEAVQQAAAARAHYGTASAIVLTNSRFTPAARTLARSNAVDLWDRDVLINMAVRARAIRSPSTPVLLAAQIGSGLAIVGRLALFLLLAIGALVDGLTSPGSSRRRPAPRRRRR